jgi:hypothetical protein
MSDISHKIISVEEYKEYEDKKRKIDTIARHTKTIRQHNLYDKQKTDFFNKTLQI